MTDLTGITAKLRRAEQQIIEVTKKIDALCDNAEQHIVRSENVSADKQVWTYCGETPSVPMVWSVIVGEILHNLRSALDHLVWQLVIANGETPGRRNEFPITEDADKWEVAKERALKGVSNTCVAKIGALQPYTGGMGLRFDVSMLKTLKQLNEIEKHRHLVLGVIALSEIHPLGLEVDHPELEDLTYRKPFEGTGFLGIVEKGKELLVFNNAGTELCPSFKIDACLSNVEMPGIMSRPFSAILRKCLDTVRGTIQILAMPSG